MEKISGILPSSSRVASVDLKESGPVRPGTPAFGRAEGASALRDAKIGQTAGRAAKLSQEQLDWRTKDMQNAATVRELSDKFFKGNMKSAIDQTVESITEKEMNIGPPAPGRASVPAGFNMPNISVMPTITTEPETEAVAQPEGLHPRGSFVDVRA